MNEQAILNPWEKRDEVNFFAAYFKTFVLLISRPVQFFKDISVHFRARDCISYIAVTSYIPILILLTIGITVNTFITKFDLPSTNLAEIITYLITPPLTLLIVFMLFAVPLFAFLKVLDKQVRFKVLVKVLLYPCIFLIVSFLPYVKFLAYVYVFILFFIGMRYALKLSIPKSLSATGFIISLFLIYSFLSLIFLGAISA